MWSNPHGICFIEGFALYFLLVRNLISREDMMVLSARAMNMAGRPLGASSDSELKGYSDSAQISGYALKDVAALIEAGVIKGSGNSINPKKTATRAETAVIIYNLDNQ
jgi:hypothetical protein